MESTRKRSWGAQAQPVSHGRAAAAEREALHKRAWNGLFGKDKPLWLRITKSAALLLAVAVVALAVVAVSMKEESSAYAAQAEQSGTQQQAASPAPGGGWQKADVGQALAAFSYQPEEAEQNCYAIGAEDAEIITGIHTRLMELGYMEADEPSATYGETTAQAVKLFERKSGFEMDGVLTQYEYELLMSDQAAKYSVSLGDEGTDVSELQRRLVELGFLEDVTGEYGIYTQKAVKAFQKANGLSADGSIGSETRELLYSEEAKGKALSYGDQAEIIKTYQQKLKDLGYYNGAVDGFFGSGLQEAVKAFQNRKC